MPALLAALDVLRAKRADVFRIYDTIPRMTDGSRREALDYLAGFYCDIGRADVVERAFVDGCRSDG